MSLSSIPKSLRDKVFQRDGGRCTYCGVYQIGQSAVFHVDHIIPRSKNGATTLDNLALQCPHCSLRKSNKTEAIDPASGQSARLYHPTADSWQDHFILEDDCSVKGLTAIGRATVDALAMNDSWPRSARMLQKSAGYAL